MKKSDGQAAGQQPRGRSRPAAKQPPLPAASSHEEWLLDQALLETFPASDPIAPAIPPDPVVRPRQ
jgi:hypothetical protein